MISAEFHAMKHHCVKGAIHRRTRRRSSRRARSALYGGSTRPRPACARGARWLPSMTILLSATCPELNLIEIIRKQAKHHWHGFLTWTRYILRENIHELLDGCSTKFQINLNLLFRLSYEPALSAPYGNTRNRIPDETYKIHGPP